AGAAGFGFACFFAALEADAFGLAAPSALAAPAAFAGFSSARAGAAAFALLGAGLSVFATLLATGLVTALAVAGFFTAFLAAAFAGFAADGAGLTVAAAASATAGREAEPPAVSAFLARLAPLASGACAVLAADGFLARTGFTFSSTCAFPALLLVLATPSSLAVLLVCSDAY